MLDLPIQLFPLLTALVIVFFIGRFTVKNNAAQAKEGLKFRLQNSEHSARPIKTSLTQTENEVATRSLAVAKLQNRFDKLQARALNKEQTDIARLLSKFAESEGSSHRLNCNSVEDDTELTRIASELNLKEGEIKQIDLSLTKVQGMQSALEQRRADMKTKLEINQTTAERARHESASLQRKINNLQMDLNDATDQKTEAPHSSDSSKQTTGKQSDKQTSIAKKSELEQSISTLRENLNTKITETKIANSQRVTLATDMTALEEQVQSLNTDVQSLQQELQGSRQHHQNSISALSKALTLKEVQLRDGGPVDSQLAELQRTHKQLENTHINALKKADQRVTDLTRELDRSEIKIQVARDQAAAKARASKANLQRQIAELKNQLSDSESELKVAYQNETYRTDTELQRETIELRAKLRELNKLLAETMAEKKALKKQLELKSNNKQAVTTISDSIGITDSTTNQKIAKVKEKKAS